MRKAHGNKKGVTLAEVTVSLAVLGIISAVVTMAFTGAMSTSGRSGQQMELNAAIGIIRENVTNAVKIPGSRIFGNDAVLRHGNGDFNPGAENLLIMDSGGNINRGYVFDIAPDEKDSPQEGLAQYLITLKKADGTTVLRRFRMEINTLPYDNTLP